MKIWALFLCAGVLAGQEFSIRPNASGNESIKLQAGVLDAEGVTLRQLLQIAYNMPSSRILGPGWLGEAMFDVHARTADLQQGLTREFGLTVKTETRPMEVYILTRLPGVEPAFQAGGQGDAHVKGTALAMPSLTSQLSEALHRPVIDETGLPGRHDVELAWESSDPGTLIDAVKRHLGLRIAEAHRPMSVLIVSRSK